AGPLPMPNMKIATGSHATGETGESSVMVGRVRCSTSRKYRIATPRLMAETVARPSPANTRIVEDRIVISTAIAGLGPALASTPICQRCAVLKNLAWPVRSARKICGGGSRRGSAQPTYQHTYQIAANSPNETIVQPSGGSQARAMSPTRRRGAAKGAADWAGATGVAVMLPYI